MEFDYDFTWTEDDDPDGDVIDLDDLLAEALEDARTADPFRYKPAQGRVMEFARSLDGRPFHVRNAQLVCGASAGMTLSVMVRDGHIARIGRGMYQAPL